MRSRKKCLFLCCTLFMMLLLQIRYADYDVDAIQKEYSDCFCKSAMTGQLHDFCYRLPLNESIVGKKFSCSLLERAERLGVLDSGTVNLHKDALPDPVFVTAFNGAYENSAVDMINSIRAHFPTTRIIIYYLGPMYPGFDFARVCNVTVRKFDLTIYPNGELREYRWKPIVIAETLKEFGAVWYMDASVRMIKGDLSHVHELVTCRRDRGERILPNTTVSGIGEPIESGFNQALWKSNVKNCDKMPYLLHGFSSHGVYPAVNPKMYDYLPSDHGKLKHVKMYDAGFVFAVHTEDVVRNVLKWYVLCALQDGCFAPPGSSLQCAFNRDRFTEYAKCHRYDQSAVNILLANANANNHHLFTSEIVDFFTIDRSGGSAQVDSRFLCQ